MANKTVYPFGTGGQLPSSIGVINDLTTGGADKALSADMGVELNKRVNTFPIATLDSVAYEGKTYRQIFEGGNSFFFDAESPFGAVNVEEYLNQSGSNIPVREQSVVDSGIYSLYCHSEVGKSSCLRQTTANTHRLIQNKIYYIACRMNVTTLPIENACGVIAESAWVIKQYGTTSGWVTSSSLFQNGSSNAKLYFGLFSGVEGDMYFDTLVSVPVEIFSTPPTKAQWDAMYAEYVAIKKRLDDSLCMAEFMRILNAKAQKIGMTDSTFSNPYGGDKYGYNWTTIEDMMKMIVYATSYPRVLDYMSQNTQVELPIYGAQARTEVFPTTANAFNDAMQSAYGAVHGAGSTMPYYVNSRKGAGWGNLDNKDATSRTRGMVGTAVIDGHNVAFCIFGCSTAYPNANTDNRIYKGIVDLLDICKAHFDGTSVGTQSYIGYFNYAMAVELPASQNECHKNNINLDVIYKKSVVVDDVETKFHTASAIKVLSMCVIFDTLGHDLHQYMEIVDYDEVYDNVEYWNPNDSGTFEGHAGDIYTLDTAGHAMLTSSNGVFTLATARKAGEKVLCGKILKGI